VKETDRIAALRAELAKVGTRVESPVDGDDDVMRVVPGSDPGGAVAFETYRDHRMAMCLSLLGLVRRGVTILDPGCVAKTYPTYWGDFAMLAGVDELSPA
jgi:3-phosphoshikimate 1-carboxyvinyltransferase